MGQAGARAAQPTRGFNLTRYRAENARPRPVAGEARGLLGAHRRILKGRSGLSSPPTPSSTGHRRPDHRPDPAAPAPRRIALKPRVLVVLAGTNDVAGNNGRMTPEQTRDNIASMAELARARDQGGDLRHHALRLTPWRGRQRPPASPPPTP